MTVESTPAIINDYKRVVRSDGNPTAEQFLYEVFEPADASWRGLGLIPGSGLAFRGPYTRFDASAHFPVDVPESKDDPRCLCAAILTGSKTPDRCGLFGKNAHPKIRWARAWVSSEGTCAAYYKYGAA